jgi:hypothetical protein
MKIPDKVKYLLVLCAGLTFFISGCVDTSVQTIPDNIVYHSQAKIVNLIPEDGGGTISANLNSTDYSIASGEEAPGNGQAFIDLVSGSKTMTVSGATTLSYQFSAETQLKMRLFVVWDTTQVRHVEIDTTVTPPDTSIILDSVITSYDVVKVNQRYVWQKKGTTEGASTFPADTIQIALFNGSPDISVTQLRLYGGSVDETVSAAVDYKGSSGYMKFAATTAGQYSLDVINGGTTVTIGPFDAAPKGRYTAVIYDYSAVVKSNILTDD